MSKSQNHAVITLLVKLNTEPDNPDIIDNMLTSLRAAYDAHAIPMGYRATHMEAIAHGRVSPERIIRTAKHWNEQQQTNCEYHIGMYIAKQEPLSELIRAACPANDQFHPMANMLLFNMYEDIPFCGLLDNKLLNSIKTDPQDYAITKIHVEPTAALL